MEWLGRVGSGGVVSRHCFPHMHLWSLPVALDAPADPESIGKIYLRFEAQVDAC